MIARLISEWDTITCEDRGFTQNTILIGKGQTAFFETNEGAKYGPNVHCAVKFKRWAGCRGMTVDCSEISLGFMDFLRVSQITSGGREDHRET